ncbi:unnamed protein product [Lactuca saligna]|uniref:PB1-like domain-containing protein n=1 Tax=Lactuca saligna TaxID=75948 RepID=A0AA35ZBB4_LACSI|nr:unnamed protein product [Lactuca saligna]
MVKFITLLVPHLTSRLVAPLKHPTCKARREAIILLCTPSFHSENPEKFQHSDKKTLIVISSPLKCNGVVAYTCKYGGNRCWTSLLGHPTIFSIRLYHGGEFTKFPGRNYIKGKQTYIDLLDMDTFSVHDIDEMMEQLGYVDEGIPLYYHFKRPFRFRFRVIFFG